MDNDVSGGSELIHCIGMPGFGRDYQQVIRRLVRDIRVIRS
jgi:hypothetical protein